MVKKKYDATMKSEFKSETLDKLYDKRVQQLISDRYSISQELAINRQRFTKPDEFKEYNTYCEQCKKTAKIEIYGTDNK